jgi:hypothetical protein
MIVDGYINPLKIPVITTLKIVDGLISNVVNPIP